MGGKPMPAKSQTSTMHPCVWQHNEGTLLLHMPATLSVGACYGPLYPWQVPVFDAAKAANAASAAAAAAVAAFAAAVAAVAAARASSAAVNCCWPVGCTTGVALGGS